MEVTAPILSMVAVVRMNCTVGRESIISPVKMAMTLFMAMKEMMLLMVEKVTISFMGELERIIFTVKRVMIR